MFIFDLLCIYLQKMKINIESTKANTRLLAYQIFMTLSFVYLLFQFIYYATKIGNGGNACLVFVTYAFAFFID